jgi:predicted RNA polymerase sigma factor
VLQTSGVNEQHTVQAHHTAEMAARRSYGKLVAILAAHTHDVMAAEDALSEAFAAALAGWPLHGPPPNPEAWLVTVARRKLIDGARRSRSGEHAIQQLQILAQGQEDEVVDLAIPDQRLALLFACAHPAIETAIRAPLMLQAVLGLTAKEIAPAFLLAPAAMGKRLVRAKEKIRQAGIPFRIPAPDELAGRLDAVLEAIYAAFAEGWADPGGIEIARRDLAEEAIFLARTTVELLPDEPEALGLLALMLHAHARRHARRTTEGEYVPFSQQDQARWDWPLIEEAERLIRRASTLGSIGRYQLEAALQSAHIYRRRTGQANWAEVVQLYDLLFALTGSPVVALNRLLAVAEIEGPQAALQALQELEDDGRLADYQPYWAARAELLTQTGALDEARHAYALAIGLARDPAVRRFLQRRQAAAV